MLPSPSFRRSSAFTLMELLVVAAAVYMQQNNLGFPTDSNAPYTGNAP
jgi:hypothetical protein